MCLSVSFLHFFSRFLNSNFFQFHYRRMNGLYDCKDFLFVGLDWRDAGAC